MPMKIYVRRRHIEKGVKGRMRECPIALAFEEITGERPCVDLDFVQTKGEVFVLPRIAKRFIYRFDTNKPVKPFAFVLK